MNDRHSSTTHRRAPAVRPPTMSAPRRAQPRRVSTTCSTTTTSTSRGSPPPPSRRDRRHPGPAIGRPYRYEGIGTGWLVARGDAGCRPGLAAASGHELPVAIDPSESHGGPPPDRAGCGALQVADHGDGPKLRGQVISAACQDAVGNRHPHGDRRRARSDALGQRRLGDAVGRLAVGGRPLTDLRRGDNGKRLPRPGGVEDNPRVAEDADVVQRRGQRPSAAVRIARRHPAHGARRAHARNGRTRRRCAHRRAAAEAGPAEPKGQSAATR